MEFNSSNGNNSLDREMERLAKIVIDKGLEGDYNVNGRNGSPSFLGMLRKHANVTHRERPHPVFPVILAGAICGMFYTGALFADFRIIEKGGRLTIDAMMLTIRDDDDQLVNKSIPLKTPQDMPDLQKVKKIILEEYNSRKNQHKNEVSV